ncbi:hypothetical protein ES708_17477 [subsurface metagenome]
MLRTLADCSKYPTLQGHCDRCLNLKHGGSVSELLLASQKGRTELLIAAPAEDEAPMDQAIETAYVVREEPPSEEPEDSPFPEDEPEIPPEPAPEPKAKPAPAKAEPAPEPKAESANIDMNWLKDSLQILQDKALKAWAPGSLLSYMKITYKVEGKTPLEVAAKLNKSQATHFVRKVQETLDRA